MAVNLKVYLMDKPFAGDNILIMGKPIKEYTKCNFPFGVHIDSLDKLDYSNTDYLAVIYNNSPLCDIDFLKEKCKEMKSSNYKKYLIGDGFIENVACENEKIAIVSHPKAARIEDYFDITLIYKYLKKEMLFKLAKQNVLVLDPETTFIDNSVKIGNGSIIYPMVTLQGKTKIGENVKIHSFCNLIDTVIGDNTEVLSSYCQSSQVGDDCSIGPFACLRQGSVIGNNCRVGDYVEIKKSTLKDNVKVAHLAYIGDSFVDEKTNVGCGTVFANYDGKQKRSVKVGKNVFIGANTNLIAPITIGDNAYIAAGSTITKDLPPDSLCVARSREVVKPDYFKNKKTNKDN